VKACYAGSLKFIVLSITESRYISLYRANESLCPKASPGMKFIMGIRIENAGSRGAPRGGYMMLTWFSATNTMPGGTRIASSLALLGCPTILAMTITDPTSAFFLGSSVL
jgi:hypothetical protein